MRSSETIPEGTESMVKLARMLLNRLERISADSPWAHRASGLRGALIRALEEIEKQSKNLPPKHLDQLSILINSGFHIIEEAARELRDE